MENLQNLSQGAVMCDCACKTLLIAYHNIEKWCDDIDKRVIRLAVASMGKDIYSSVEKINKLTDSKFAYINAKVIVDTTLRAVKDKKIIICKYILNLPNEAIAKGLGVDERTVRRKLNVQEKKLFDKMIYKFGLKKIIALIQKDEQLFNLYKILLKDKRKRNERKKF